MRAILDGMLGKIPIPSPSMVVALFALLVAASGVAVAAGSVTGSDGTITACRDNKSGALRVINAEGGQACASKETKLTWKDGITGKVADSEKLDGQDSAAFLGANQRAANSDELDGLDSTDFARAYERTVLVSPVGTPAENGAVLRNALSGITGASANNPYLLKIEPGIYDVGGSTSPLTMEPYVDVEGSGEGITTITATGGEDARTGTTVAGGANSELRSLTVKSVGGDVAVAVFNNASTFRLTGVTATASAGNTNVGLLAAPNSTTTLNLTTLTASGGSESLGVSTDVNSTTRIRNSRIAGGTHTIDSAGTTLVAASQLEGGGTTNAGGLGDTRCAGVWDGNFIFYGTSTCP